MSGQPPRKKSRFFSEGKSKIGGIFKRKNNDRNTAPSAPAPAPNGFSTAPPRNLCSNAHLSTSLPNTPHTTSISTVSALNTFSNPSSTAPATSFGSQNSGPTQVTSFQSTNSSFDTANNIVNQSRPAPHVSFTSTRNGNENVNPGNISAQSAHVPNVRDDNYDKRENAQPNPISPGDLGLPNLTVRDRRRDGIYGAEDLNLKAGGIPRSSLPLSTTLPNLSFPNTTLSDTLFQASAARKARQRIPTPASPPPEPESRGPPFEVYRILQSDHKTAEVDAKRTGRPIASYFEKFDVPGEPFWDQEEAKEALRLAAASKAFVYQLEPAGPVMLGIRRAGHANYPPLAHGYQTHPVHGQLPLRQGNLALLERIQLAKEQSEGPLGSMATQHKLPPQAGPLTSVDPIKRQQFVRRRRSFVNLDQDVDGNLTHQHRAQPVRPPILNFEDRGITSLPLHATAHPARRRSAHPTLYHSPERIPRVIASINISRKRKRKRPGPVLPPPAYIYRRTNSPNFNIFSAILLYPEVVFAFAAQLTVNDLVSLYAISRDFHVILDTRLTSFVLSQSLGKAPESSHAFHWQSYKWLCRHDPASRIPHPDPRQAAAGQPRLVPSFKWLRMILYREKVVHAIMTIFAEDGIPLPPRCGLALKRVWYMLDIPDNGRRIGYVHNRSYFTDLDLYFAMCFFVKLDMRLNDPVAGECRHGMRKMLLAQPTLTTVLKVLKRDIWQKQIDVMKAWVAYRYQPQPDERGMDIFGVPAVQVGKGIFEYWGKKSPQELGRNPQSLLRPDQLVMREAIRRGIRFHKHFLRSMLYGYIDMATLEDYKPRDLRRRAPGIEDEYGVDDEIGGAECPEWEETRDVLDLGERREVSTLCVVKQVESKADRERRAREECWVEMCYEWSRAERQDLMEVDG